MCNSHSEIIYSNARWTLWNSFQINYMTTLPKEHMEKIFLRNYFTNKTIVMNKYQNSYFYETHIFSLLLCECVCIRLNNNFEKTEEKTKYTMRNLIHYRKVNKHASVLYIYMYGWVGVCVCGCGCARARWYVNGLLHYSIWSKLMFYWVGKLSHLTLVFIHQKRIKYRTMITWGNRSNEHQLLTSV